MTGQRSNQLNYVPALRTNDLCKAGVNIGQISVRQGVCGYFHRVGKPWGDQYLAGRRARYLRLTACQAFRNGGNVSFGRVPGVYLTRADLRVYSVLAL
jgi:hypothetical protein